jgi:S-adenosylmethionine:tRNA ribosyltransferase-isomerase
VKLSQLDFSYPEELIAVAKTDPSRVLWQTLSDSQVIEPEEISIDALIERIPPGDGFVINNTKVEKRRIFAKLKNEKEFEILFVEPVSKYQWKVLCPAKQLNHFSELTLPGDLQILNFETGRVQLVTFNKEVTESYFAEFGEMPLPPYIQKARKKRHTEVKDESGYQTAWAKRLGSSAAPTASLHFSERHIERLRQRKVQVIVITLHVGLGTYLPVSVEDLDQHYMHNEWCELDAQAIKAISECKKSGAKIWALGTTAVRTLESYALGKLSATELGGFAGYTDLLIQPGFEYKMTDRILTNFHQPQSTLLALVAAFSSLETVLKVYAWAMDRKFKLFSYGDLTVWVKS